MRMPGSGLGIFRISRMPQRQDRRSRSFVRSVPVGGQNCQGGVLSQFFQRSGVQPGDPFDVMFGP